MKRSYHSYRRYQSHSHGRSRGRRPVKALRLSFGAAAALLLLAALAVRFIEFDVENTATADNTVDIPRRVVSLAPSITELIYALDVDSLLVGVTRFCKYPPPADTLPEVGGYLDVNLEALVALEPDLVILLRESDAIQEKLKTLRIPFLVVDHQTVNGIIESYRSVGRRLNSLQADSLARETELFLKRVREITMESSRPSVLLSVGHDDTPGEISNVYAAAQEGFYSEMLEVAGARNVLEDNTVRYPALSAETITSLKPDYIIDIFASGEQEPDKQFVREQWSSLSDVPAVRNNRVIILTGQRFVIPGPRFVEIVREFVAVLHPDLVRLLSATP